MRRSVFRATCAVGLAVAMLVGAGAVASSSGKALPVVVPADAGWVSTGVTVTAGVPIPVTTLGYVQTASIPAFHVPGVFKGASGPEGQSVNTWSSCVEAYNTFEPWLKELTGPCVLDSAYFGELIGRVGGTVFRIGDTTQIVPPATGMLELTVGEFVNTYDDNRGAFTVIFWE